MLNHREYLEKALQLATRAEHLSEDSAGFFRSVYIYQAERLEVYTALAFDGDWVRRDKMPIVDVEAFSIAAGEYAPLKEGMEALLSRLSGLHKGMKFDRIRELFSGGTDPMNRAARALLARDFDAMSAQSQACGLGVEEYIFVLVNWLKPFFAALAEKYGADIRQDEWMESRCPVCGFYPDMAKIVGAKDGRRFLHCALCEYEWHFKRIACPVCDNEDTEKLGYFAVEGETAYRVDFCDECKGYIKTIQLGKFQEPENCDLTVENILTTDLDAAAMKKGYARP
ncbi:MAG: formate dehydrogenase accessory protein FdhE [Spirochaetales bacterium]|nr:MAG: formate dehydrogenase accessory protein FdhE [Spirochaetales bacterium]